MARVEISEAVLKATVAAAVPIVGAAIQVNVRDGAAATVYVAATGGATKANPLTSDSAGRIEGWLEEGSYDLVVSGSGITTYTERFEAVSMAAGARLPTVESGHFFASVTPDSAAAAAANKTAIDAAIAAAVAAGGGVVWIKADGDIYTNGGHDIPRGVKLDTPGWATRLIHRGSSWCVRLIDETADQAAPEIGCLKVMGSLAGVAAVAGAVGVEFGNGYNFKVDRLWVDGFTDNGTNVKFHNTVGAYGWSGGHKIGQLVTLNATRCIQFIADAATSNEFGEIEIDKAMIQPSASQVGISFSRGMFYNSRISGALNIGGNNAIAVEIVTADAQVRASHFNLSGETDGTPTGVKRVKFTAAGQFDATGRIFINGQPPDDLALASIWNFVEAEQTYVEATNTHNRTIVSAATITIPGGASTFNVTGTTNIGQINSSWEGRVVVLKFAGALTVNSSGNIRLAAGARKTQADDTLILVHLGGVWYEVEGAFRQVLMGAAAAPAGFGAAVTVKARAVGTEAAVFQRFSSGQTADIMFAADESGNFYTGFNKDGYLRTRKLSPPADADLIANDLYMWLDPTNGAAKAMFKGKSANGTVVTGSVPLT